MLFKLSINRTTSSRTLFGIKTKNVENEYLISAENEQQLIEHLDDLPKEGVDIWSRNLWGTRSQSWQEEQTWKKMEGDDKDAHILILKSPTGVIYTKQLKYT